MTNEITDKTFEAEVLKAKGPVLVDFFAEWCGPCRLLLPIITELAEEMKDKIKIVKCNVDENPNTPAQYGVRGIPSLMIFKDGEVIANKTGASSKAALQIWIEENL
ncbi:thioredoxin [Pseudomonadota bacterium]